MRMNCHNLSTFIELPSDTTAKDWGLATQGIKVYKNSMVLASAQDSLLVRNDQKEI